MSSGFGLVSEANRREGYGLNADISNNGIKSGGGYAPQELDSRVNDQNFGLNAEAERLAGNQTPARVAPGQLDRMADALTAGHDVFLPPPPQPYIPQPGMQYAAPQGPPQLRVSQALDASLAPLTLLSITLSLRTRQ